MPLALQAMDQKQETRFRFISRPNCSLSERERKMAFWVIAGVTMGIAAVFAGFGYWLTLPFAGLEVLVLAWAFDVLHKRSGDFEMLVIDDDEVLLERKSGGQEERFEFNRQWVSLVQNTDRLKGPIRLALRSHGRETELGLFLTEEARIELGKNLQSWLRSGK